MNYELACTSTESAAWMAKILRDRFGGELRVEYLPQVRQWQIRLDAQDHSIRMSELFSSFKFGVSDLPCNTWVPESEGWVSPYGEAIPTPGLRLAASPLIVKADYGWYVDYDVLGLAFWMLNRIEEIGRVDLDSHNRFAAVSSHAYKHNYLERPIVDEWFSILAQVMQRTWPNFHLKQHDFNVRVSHDVDRPSRYAFRTNLALLRAMAGDFKKGNYWQALAAYYIKFRSRNALHEWDPYNTFDWIMDISEANSIKSSFYFISGRTNRDMDSDYEIEDPRIRQLIRKISKRGHEIGLHPSYESYKSSVLIDEADRLRRVLEEEKVFQKDLGGRMHYLRWEQPTTLLLWDEAGMSYDSTMSYPDRAGFRAGTCFDYCAFDPVGLKSLSIRIRPLVAMEATVMSSSYMGLGTGPVAYRKLKELKTRCEVVKGSFTLLWHNSQFDTKSERDLYQYIVKTER